jgi:NAD(P)-dependent dehydrogenase (short-subunit alcohol dehydrogenase family)
MKKLVSIVALVLILVPLPPVSADEHAPRQKAVLITGATTGIGRATAEHLAAAGYFVYAGARKDADMEALNKIENIMAVRLDVTKQDQVDEAVRLIEDQGRGLWGLVNNAGVAVFAPLTVASEADARFMFDVNVFGVLRVTQAFAPIIVESKGRIVNISSISGVWSPTIGGMYSASKHALEAMTDALALELGELGVHVTAVNPGAFASAGFVKDCTQLQGDVDADWGSLEDYRQQRIESCKKEDKSTAADPIGVAVTIEQALFEDRPRDHYLVASQLGAGQTIAWAVVEMLALNMGHDQSYTRDEIVQFVDMMWPYMIGEKSWNSLEEEWEFHDSWVERRVPDVD